MAPDLREIFGKGKGRRGSQEDGRTLTPSPGDMTPSRRVSVDGVPQLMKTYAGLVQALVTAWKRNNSHDEIIERLGLVVRAVRRRCTTPHLRQLGEMLEEMDALVTAVDEKRLPLTKEFINLAGEFGGFADEALRNSGLPKRARRKITLWQDRYHTLMLSAEQVTDDSKDSTGSLAWRGAAIQRPSEPAAASVDSGEICPNSPEVNNATTRISELEGKLDALQAERSEPITRFGHETATPAQSSTGQENDDIRVPPGSPDVEDLENLLFLKRGRASGKEPERTT